MASRNRWWYEDGWRLSSTKTCTVRITEHMGVVEVWIEGAWKLHVHYPIASLGICILYGTFDNKLINVNKMSLYVQ